MAPKSFFGKLRDALIPSPATQAAGALRLQAQMFAGSYNAGYSLSDDVSPLSGKRRPYDYSAESLAEVDQLIEDLLHGSDPAEAEDRGLLIAGAGAYYGEVIVRNLGGEWEPPAAGGQTAPSRVQVAGPDGTLHSETPFERVTARTQSRDSTRLEAAYAELRAKSSAAG